MLSILTKIYTTLLSLKLFSFTLDFFLNIYHLKGGKCYLKLKKQNEKESREFKILRFWSLFQKLVVETANKHFGGHENFK